MSVTLVSSDASSLSTTPASEMAQLKSIEFWRDTFPELSVETLFSTPFELNEPSPQATNRATARMASEGYFQENDPVLTELASKLSSAVDRLVKMNLPPVFAFVFDEAWAVFYRQHHLISRLLGPDYQTLPDFWVWHVDPNAGQAGWRPHRDKGYSSLAADGTPLSLTMWVPITEATPLNGCMYILPADRDPVYGTPQDKAWNVDFPSIRALPGKPGDWFCWNQAVLHWGAKTSPFAAAPRMSMALEFQRSEIPPMNEPLLGRLSVLSFESRIKLISKQILQYAHMYPLPDAMRSFASEALS